MASPITTIFLGDYYEQYKKSYPSGNVTDSNYAAFRNAYASAILTRKLGAEMAEKFGNIYEFLAFNNADDAQHQQDFYNNKIGRDLVKDRADLQSLSNDDIADFIKTAIDENSLILDKNDPRTAEISDDYWNADQVKTWATDVQTWMESQSSQISQSINTAYYAFTNTVANAFAPHNPLIIDTDNNGLNLRSWEDSGVRFDLDNDGTSERSGWTSPSLAKTTYNSGSGSYVFTASTAVVSNQINFGVGIEKSDLIFSRPTTSGHSNDLVISFSNNSQDQLVILGYFSSDAGKVDLLRFSNGATFNMADLEVEEIQTNTNYTSDPLATQLSLLTITNDDAFLAIDKNANGTIDDAGELFGNSTSSGFAELRKYDSNVDNVINTNDSQFNLLKLWKDYDGDGVTDAGELTSLADNGISEISLRTLNTNTSISGNVINQIAEVKLASGNTRTISEILFATNSFDNSPADSNSTLGSDFVLDVDTLLLPYSRGYGSLYSWQVAMSLDNDLLEIAQQLVNLAPENFYQIDSIFEGFLFKWAGVENATQTEIYERGSSNKIDVRKVAFLEKITKLDFRFPDDNTITQAQYSWDLFYNSFLSRFLVQGTFASIFPQASYDFTSDTLSLNGTLEETIANILSLADSLDKNSFLNYAYYSKNILQLNRDQFNDTDFDNKVNAMLTSIIGSVTIDGFSFTGAFNIGTNQDEILYGSSNADILKGQDGVDTIYAGSSNDYIEGGLGNDYLKGEAGNDIYKFSLGDGQDVIEDSAGTDKIIFGYGITQSSLIFAQVGNDLVINVGSGGDQIGIKNFYTTTTNRVETIEFANGDIFNLSGLEKVIYGDAANNTISGSNNNDILDGGAGNDLIYALNGNDRITGGAGNDYLESGSGDNVYIFNLGDGQDVIRDASGNDQIIFGANIAKSDITLISDFANDQSLIIKIGSNGDQITIKYFFQSQTNSNKIETLLFADGSTINLANGVTLQGSSTAGEVLMGTLYSDTLTGNSGNDEIYAGYGDDILSGGKGNDYIENYNLGAADGNDTYIFNLGDGQDVLFDDWGSDKIIFGAGITQADIILTEAIDNQTSLIIKVGTAGDQIRIRDFFSFNTDQRKIETLQFADGSIIDLSAGITIQGLNVAGETLMGTSYGDVITGNIGADIIYGSYGNDIIAGGKGDDYIAKYNNINSDDTYIFNIGDGQDTIYDAYGIDKILFGAGITQSNISIVSDYSNSKSVIIKVGVNGDQIRIVNFFNNSTNYEKIETLQFADGSTINLANGLTLQGSNTSGEVLMGTLYSDTLTGSSGNDEIYAGYGDDILSGGTGNDYIENYNLGAADGNDTYIFNLGDGQDIIFDDWGSDKIIFGAGITQADIILTEAIDNQTSLIIKVGTSGDQIRLRDFFKFSTDQRKIETLQFADGSIIDLSAGITIQGLNVAGETLMGTSYGDVITGNSGDDVLFVGGGNDISTGGKGNDYIENYNLGAADGNDTYIFNLGDGQDIIFDDWGSDKIIFGAGITQADIVLTEAIDNQTSLIIKVGNGGDQIRLRDFFKFSTDQRKIETLQFADGSIIDLSAGITIQGLNVAGETLMGTSYGDVITGNSGDDVLFVGGGNDISTGGKGNDYIENYNLGAADGNDTYIFNLGDGQDIIFDDWGSDKIIFGAGITQADIILTEAIDNQTSLIIKVGTAGDQIRIRDFFSFNTDQRKIETLQFADGSIIDLSAGITIQGLNVAGETLMGTSYGDVITGNIGADIIYGSYGNDIIAGGKGDDYIAKYNHINSDDTYIFNIGDGQDTIYDAYGIDKILFGAGITQSNISIVSDYSNSKSVIIKVGVNGDQIRIVNFFNNSTNYEKIETLQFADGSTINLANGLTLQGSNTAGEVLMGTFYNDTITGNNGNDEIYAGYGDDILSGGTGNDYIENYNYGASDGNDTYIFNLGDGQDIIFDDWGTDKIIFGAGITQADIVLTEEINSQTALIIKFGNGGDQIKIRDFFTFATDQRKIETLQFADGSIMDLRAGLTIQGLNAGGESLLGTYYGDVITGNVGADIIYSSFGNDIITGGKGDDYMEENGSINSDETYIFNLGDGQDTIYDVYGNDKIIFGAGITQQNISMQSVGINLVIKIADSSDQITIKNFFANSKIETIQFSDGTSFAISDGITATGSAINDTIIGTPFADNLGGAAGNDYIYSGGGSDTLNGGIGNDLLRGGEDSDTYIFGPNYNIDEITEEGGAADIISFGSGIDSSSISMSKSGNNLIIFQQGTSDIITIANFFATAANRVEYLTFASGEKFNLSNITSADLESFSYSVNGYAITKEDSAVKIKLLNSDDQTAVYSSIISLSNPLNGSVTQDNDGNIIYTPHTNYNGSDSFVISYLDIFGVAQSKNITLNILPTNDNPTASDLSLELNEDESLEIAALSNASDIDGDTTLAISYVANPTYGSVSIVNGKIIYTPNSNFNGTDSFQYSIIDNNGGSDTKTISLNILPINDAPISTNDSATTNEDQAILIDITNNDYDIETGFINSNIISITEGPAHGLVTIQADGKIYYNPDLDYDGSDSFKYTITDSGGLVSNVSTVSLTVNNVNDAPKVISSNSLSFTEDTAALINVSDYFYDPENDTFEITAISATSGTVEIIGNQIAYLANNNFSGIDHINVTLKDAHGALSNFTVNATVSGINDAPIAQNDSFTVFDYSLTRLTALNNDSDIEDVLFASSIINFTNPLHGTISVNSVDGSFSYQVEQGYIGTDYFTYTIADSAGLTSSATVNINSTLSNFAPVAVADNFTTNEDQAITISFADIFANDSDIEDGIAIQNLTQNKIVFGTPSNGSIAVNFNNRTLTYTPNKDFNGSDSISYQIKDSGNKTASSAINLNILPIYDAITLPHKISSKQAQIDKSFSYNLGTLFTNVDHSTLQITLDALPSWLSFNAETLELTGTPTDADYGFEIINVTATDGTTTIETKFNLITDKELEGDDDANIIQASNGSVSGIIASPDLLIGSQDDDVMQFVGDENWGADFLSYNYYSGDLLSITGKLVSFDAFDGQDGIDTINLTNNSDGIFLDNLVSLNPSKNGSRLFGIEIINGEDGDDLIDLSSLDFTYGNVTLNGGNGDDVLWSNDGDDIINGDSGNDQIVGGRGDDIMSGGTGNDTIKGYIGDDTLIGGAGADNLTGGAGNDIFSFSSLSDSTINSSDLITDFTKGEDSISFSGLNFTGITSNTNSTDANSLIYHFDNGTTVIENSDHTFMLKLTGNIALDESDFNF